MPAPTKLGLDVPLPAIQPKSASPTNPPASAPTPGILASKGNTKWLPAVPSNPNPPAQPKITIGAQRAAVSTPPTTNVQVTFESNQPAPLSKTIQAQSTGQTNLATVQEMVEDTKKSLRAELGEAQRG